MTKVITRFAPSPTGNLHIGGARTALFSFLYAKKRGGEMILRIEDTDKERSEKKYEDDILNGLKWLGIEYSELFRQSERGDKYAELIQRLINEDKAYISKEEEGERDEVIRLRNPGGEIVFNDLIRGEIKTDVSELGDFIIAKSLTEPVFHFANVADDHDMEVTHIIRGEDHISNTPRQILIREALGFPEFNYAHLPLILGSDKSKLSKRHGAVSVNEYQKDYLPEALVNYLALLGWNPGDEREIFTMNELLKKFSLEKVQKSGAVFNLEKLDWINKQHLAKLSNKEFLSVAGEYIPDNLKDSSIIMGLIKEKANKFSDIGKMVESGEFDFYTKSPEYDKEKLLWKDETKDVVKETLEKVLGLVEGISNFSKDSVKEAVQPYADEKGRGSVLHPTRFALTGKDRSPDPFTVSGAIGKEETIKRLNKAIMMLS